MVRNSGEEEDGHSQPNGGPRCAIVVQIKPAALFWLAGLCDDIKQSVEQAKMPVHLKKVI